MKKIFILMLVLLLVFSTFQIIKTTYDYKKSQQMYESLQKEFVETQGIEDTEPEISPQPIEKVETVPITIDFVSLLEQNSDVVGWIYCQDTPINYPVVQAKDNDKYLRRDLNGKYLVSGTVFVDYRNGEIGADRNFIIYGHNMKNSTMFGTLVKYKEQAYYDAHPTMYYLTPNGNYIINLIAGAVVKRDSNIYSTTPDEQVFADLVSNSTFHSEAELCETDSIITLSTCSYEFNNARYVLIGKLK